MELLEVHKISKTYGSGEAAVQALKQASFSICLPRKLKSLSTVSQSSTQ